MYPKNDDVNLRKIEKKILKMVEQEKIEKVINFVTQIILESNDEEKSEAISSLKPLFIKIKEKNFPFPDNLFDLLIRYLESENWIVRRNILEIIAEITELYIEFVLSKNLIKKLKQKAIKDKHWAVRINAIKILGLIGLKFPEKDIMIETIISLIEDKDPEIRLATLESLTLILKECPDKIKPILPIFVKRFKDDDDYRVSLCAENAIKEFAAIKEKLDKEKE